MADNYLEKAREQYEKRKAEWLNKKKKHPKTKGDKIEKPEDWSL
jgi:hypothetical protein